MFVTASTVPPSFWRVNVKSAVEPAPFSAVPGNRIDRTSPERGAVEMAVPAPRAPVAIVMVSQRIMCVLLSPPWEPRDDDAASSARAVMRLGILLERQPFHALGP